MVTSPLRVGLLALPLLAFAGCHAAACPETWTAPPPVDPSIAVPAGAGGVLLHGTATGTQGYACVAGADGAPAWSPTGPRAELRDCRGDVVLRHFASAAGAAAPEWQAADGTYVVARKSAAFTPGGRAGSVPWLLLAATDHGGTGALARIAYVQRVNTESGVAPSGACEVGAKADVAYSAEYYFFGK